MTSAPVKSPTDPDISVQQVREAHKADIEAIASISTAIGKKAAQQHHSICTSAIALAAIT